MKFLLVLAFLALATVSLAQIYYPGQTVLTGVGEIALDGHSKIAYQGYQNPALNPNPYGYINYGYPSAGLSYGLPIWKRR